MATDNRQEYGLRWSVAANGGRPYPTPLKVIVATSQSFDINGGASNVAIGPGDVVRSLSTGGVGLCDGAEGAGGATSPRYVVVGVGPYWDAANSRMTFGNTLPSDVAWGTILDRQSTLYVVPVEAGVWEVDCDEATTATTKAAYQAFIGEHADLTHSTTSTNTRPTPRLDISSHATTSTLVWNIVGVSDTINNQDFAGNYVKMLIRPNVIQLVTAGMTGV